MKKMVKKIDWVQIGVLSIGLVATLAKSIYEAKRFDQDLEEKYEKHFEKKVSEIVDKRLSKLNK